MKIISMKGIAIFLLVVLLLINILLFVVNENDPTPPIASFIGQQAVLATGYNFENSKPVVIDSLTSITLTPCNNNIIDRLSKKNTYQTQSQFSSNSSEYIGDNNLNLDCKTEIVNPTPFLKEAIQNSKFIIKGIIRKNGKEIPARFAVSVTALYEGSKCQTFFSGAEQWERCRTVKQDCRDVLSSYQSFPEPYRSNVIATCSGFPFWS